MSTSSYAIDSAWSHLENDDKIEKLLPLAALAVPAAFGALGAYTGAGGRFTDDEGNLDLNFGGNAVLQDPLTGGLIAEKELGGSLEDRVAGGLVGATQAINPFAYVGAAGRGIKGLRAGRQASRMATASQAGDDAARLAAQAGKSAAEIKQARLLAEEAVLYPGVRNVQVAPGVVDSSMSLGGMARRGVGGAVDATGRSLRGLGASRLARFGGRAAQLAGQTQQQFGDEAAALLAAGALSKLPSADTSTGGFASPQSQAGAFGAGGGAASGFGQDYGVGDLSSQFSNLTERKQIWDPSKGGAFEAQAEFGGYKKGDNMKIGEQILKEVTERMNDEYLSKAKCPKCGQEHLAKMGCVAKAEKCPHCDGDAPRSKCICGEAKKADKKPAHGMVIVIGSKAGPGPSKDGKRQKLDSEKDKKEE
ncbi:MAG: hypothetical protein VW270_10160 [Candidatus Poseidoniales archaeon]